MNFFPAHISATHSGIVLDTGCFQVSIPPAMQARYRKYAGREVIFGIRPADIHSADFIKEFFADANTIAGKVEVIEPLGSEILLVINCGANNFVARVDPRVETDIGQEIRIFFDMEKMHIFGVEPPHRRIEG
ncbi:MAG: ABC transporter ATP-binding protein, partial [Desulfobacterales bacterium]